MGLGRISSRRPISKKAEGTIMQLRKHSENLRKNTASHNPACKEKAETNA